MSEKKEKQWAVLKYPRNTQGNAVMIGLPLKIEWFDARKDAREYAAVANGRRSKKYSYAVVPMTRGPGA